jgi:chitin disaccharide deacetylase
LAGRLAILNSDDFGYSAEINAAVVRAHRLGTLTSASLMVAETAWQQAVELARNEQGLGVGLHVCVTNDRPLLTADQIPDLIAPTGKFGADPFTVGLRYAFSGRCSSQLLKEMEAQFARFASTGLPWSHADGHQHFHLHPTVWRHFIDLCDAYDVRCVRLPHESLRAHLRGVGDRSAINVMALFAFRALRRRAIKEMQRRMAGGRPPYFWCDNVYGLLQTGNMNLAYLKGLCARLPQGISEIYFHPAAPHARPLEASMQTDARDVEAAALFSPELPNILKQQHLRLVTYSEAAAHSVQ